MIFLRLVLVFFLFKKVIYISHKSKDMLLFSLFLGMLILMYQAFVEL